MLTRRFSPIEIAMVLLVGAIVVQAVLSRTLRYFEIAEKAAMTITVLEVERGMRVRLALGALAGAPAPGEKAGFEGNPFTFARAVPPNYLGELGAPDIEKLARGNWFYDRDRAEIAYLPRLASRLKGPDGEELQILRFRIENRDGRHGLPRLAPIPPYRWEPEFAAF